MKYLLIVLVLAGAAPTVNKCTVNTAVAAQSE